MQKKNSEAGLPQRYNLPLDGRMDPAIFADRETFPEAALESVRSGKGRFAIKIPADALFLVGDLALMPQKGQTQFPITLEDDGLWRWRIAVTHTRCYMMLFRRALDVTFFAREHDNILTFEWTDADILQGLREGAIHLLFESEIATFHSLGAG